MLPCWLARGSSEAVETIETAVEAREAGKSWREAGRAAEVPEASYQRLQYWRRRLQEVRRKVRGLIPTGDGRGTDRLTGLRDRLAGLGHLVGPLTQRFRKP